MMLNFLQCIGQPPQEKNYTTLNISSARLRNPGLDISFSSVSTEAYSCEGPVTVEDLTGDLGETGRGMRGYLAVVQIISI